MANLALLQKVLIWAAPVLFAVTVHEVAHGWVASRLGDKTALMLGRLTLNPFKHIDLVGTIIVPIACLLFGGFIFGWAKPVPVNFRNLNNPKRDMLLVAIAGPLTNIIMAIGWAIVAKIGEMIVSAGISNAIVLVYMGTAGMSINAMLAILNIIPIPPLDGSRVLSSLLPNSIANAYNKIEPFGLIILLVLIATNVLSLVLMPCVLWMQKVLSSIFGL